MIVLAVAAGVGSLGSVSTWTAAATHGTTSPVTGTAPSGTPSNTTQLRLLGARKFRVTACAPSGQTLSAGGSLQNYDYVTAISLWARFPGSDLPLTNCSTTQRCCAFDVMNEVGGQGYTVWIPSAVTFNGGSTGITVTMEAIAGEVTQ